MDAGIGVCRESQGLFMYTVLFTLMWIGIPCYRDLPPCYEQDELAAAAESMELRCVLAVVRHGDRTPKQKMKMTVTQASVQQRPHPKALCQMRSQLSVAAVEGVARAGPVVTSRWKGLRMAECF